MKQIVAHYKEFGAENTSAYKGAWFYDVIDPEEGFTSSDSIETDNDDPMWAEQYFVEQFPGINIVISYESGE